MFDQSHMVDENRWFCDEDGVLCKVCGEHVDHCKCSAIAISCWCEVSSTVEDIEEYLEVK